MVDLKIVPLRDGGASLNDIPGMLRQTADQIESGKYEGATACFVVFPVKDGWPIVLGFGDVDGRNDPAIQLELAKMWLLNNLTSRG
jgi:hypothetical protein